MKTVLVFGAGGRLGKELCQQLGTSGVARHIIAITHDAVDVTDSMALKDCLDHFDPDVVINCSAFNGLEACANDVEKAMATNATAPCKMAKWCDIHKALFIHFSTDYASSAGFGNEIREHGAGEPISFYGASKRAGEVLIRCANLRHLIFRISSLYGKDLAGSLSPLRDFKKEGTEYPLKVFRQFAAPISTRLVAMKTIAAMELTLLDEAGANAGTKYGLFNLANKDPMSKLAFGKLAVRFVHRLEANIKEASDLPIRRPEYSVLAVDKFVETFGIPADSVYSDLHASFTAWGLFQCSTKSP